MMPGMDLTLVTCQLLPEPDHDQAPLLEALAAAGVEARMAAWDDPDVDWSAAPLTVLRSTWNYADDRDEFLRWMRRASSDSTVLRNPVSIAAPNTHKSYLAGLERAGLPVVPTRWFARGDGGVDAATLRELAWSEIVVKPAVGAGSRGVRAFDLGVLDELDAAIMHVGELRAAGEVLVQPRLASIAAQGERDVVWIAGECTHVVTKLSRLEGEQEQVETVSEPTDAQVALARRALRCMVGEALRDVLYARVDLAVDDAGIERIMEVELVEPSLFVAQHEGAMQRFVDALAGACGIDRR